MSRKPIEARPPDRFPPLKPVTEDELDAPSLTTVCKVICNTVARIFHDPVGMILGSTFVLLLVWGFHGRVDLIGEITDSWAPFTDVQGRPSIIPGVPWDQEWLAYFIGFGLLVVIPVLLIILVYKQAPADYGLGLPPRDRWRFVLLAHGVLLTVGAVVFLAAARNGDMRAEYPLFRGTFDSDLDFAIYEAGYLTFFVAIEFIFRGYLLFGLFGLRDKQAPPGTVGESGPLVFGHYAVLISMLSYTAWHLGKPLGETWGTIVWGLVAAPIALKSRTVVPLIIVHWLLNVWLDLAIREGWHLY